MLSLFESVKLPYDYAKIPYHIDEENIKQDNRLKYYVNRVMTQLSRDSFKKSGFKSVKEIKHCNVIWGRQLELLKFSSVQPWQKVNHFAGCSRIGRKDNFHKVMMKLKRKNKIFSKIYPASYLLPDDRDVLVKKWTKSKMWIKKPIASSRGRGVKVVSSSDTSVPQRRCLIQTYISDPYLITGRKFDLRMYVVVTSVSPFRIYLHSKGIVRFATHQYDYNVPDDRKSHLTNFSINKKDVDFIRSDGAEEKIESSKWTLEFFYNYLEENGEDVKLLKERIIFVITSAFVSGLSSVAEKHLMYVFNRHSSMELYGVDLLIDEKLNPYIIEVNISPSLSGSDSKLDYNLKSEVMLDTLRISRIIDTDPNSPTQYPHMMDKLVRSSIKSRKASDVVKADDSPPVFADMQCIRDYLEEDLLRGNLNIIYPVRGTLELIQIAHENMSSLDIQFHRWIMMSDENREQYIKKYLNMYKSSIEMLLKT